MKKEIKKLKKEAKKYYLEYHKILNNYSCGGTLAEYINPELNGLKLKFNETLDKLSKIDPTCTSKRM